MLQLIPTITISIMATFPFTSLIIFLFLYFIGAIGEELGWSGYATEPLQTKFGAFKASLILGSVWAVWHIVPYIIMGRTFNWILLQSISTILLRVIMVWIFNNTNKSVFAMILFHAMINLSPYLLAVDNVNFNPFILTISLLVCTATILIFWRTDNFKLKV